MAAANPVATLEEIVAETRAQFIAAKADGKLDAGEVVQIAVAVAQRVQRLRAGLVGAEKKALVLLVLKRGLEAAGGVRSLPGFAELGEEAAKALEAQLLSAAGAALDVVVAAAAGRLDLRRREGRLACLGACLSVGQAVAAVALKDQPLLKEAVEFAAEQAKAAAAAKAPEPRAAESASPESGAPAATPVAKDTTPPSQSQTEPSPAASAEAAPAPAPVEVKFD